MNPSEVPQIRQGRGERLSPVQEVLMYHDDAGPVPETFRRLRAALDREGIPYVLIGALPLSAYRFRRATDAVDLCLRWEDLERFRQKLVGTL